MDPAKNEDWPTLPAAEQYVQVGQAVTTFSDDLSAAREHFRLHHALHIRDFFDPALLATIQRIAGNSYPDPLRPGAPEVESPQRAGLLIDTVMKRPNFLHWLQDVADTEPLVSFEGRYTQARPSSGQREWHDDLQENPLRRVALVINLSPAPYQGAPFQLIRKSGEHLLQHHYSQVNEAVLFQVDPTLAHRVPPVTAGGPRRVYAGWGLAPA